MNRKEALKAMADGHIVRVPNGSCLFRLTPYGLEIEYADGNYRTLVSFLEDEYEIVRKPNPHKAGTFLWAEFEYRRGNDVVSGERKRRNLANWLFMPGYKIDWDDREFYGFEFGSEMWEVE